MDEFFRRLTERARYYEQFESFRGSKASGHSEQLSKIPETISKDSKTKVSILNL